MKISIPLDCYEVENIDTPPCPQTHVDLAAVEYRKAQLGRCEWKLWEARYWASVIHYTLKQSRN